MKSFFSALAILAFSSSFFPLSAQVPAEIEIVFDASKSMNDSPRGVSKLEEAKQVLTSIAGQINEGSLVGLRIFGQKPVRENIRESCVDSTLALPIGPFDKNRMVQAILPIQSYGMTALGFSLEQAAKDFSPGEVKKTIILISDGEETCGKDPAQVVEALKAQGIGLTIHAVGFDASAAAKAQLSALAQMTGGTYREAANAGELEKALEETVEKTMLLETGSGGSAGENLLSAAAGTRIVSATHKELAHLIDGDDKKYISVNDGEEMVLSFRDGKAVMLEKISVPVFEVSDYNMRDIYFSASNEGPDTGFVPIAHVQTQNRLLFDSVYQEYPVTLPYPAKYLKIVLGKGHNAGHSSAHEIKAYGKYLTENEFAEAVLNLPQPELNVLGAEYGGKLVAATNMNFKYLIDGKAGTPGESVDVKPGEEGIFTFAGSGPAEITRIEVPVFAANTTNCKTLEFFVSDKSATGPFTKAGSFESTNMVFADDPYQKQDLPAPAKGKYFKIRIADTHGAGWCRLPEVRAIGKKA